MPELTEHPLDLPVPDIQPTFALGALAKTQTSPGESTGAFAGLAVFLVIGLCVAAVAIVVLAGLSIAGVLT